MVGRLKVVINNLLLVEVENRRHNVLIQYAENALYHLALDTDGMLSLVNEFF